MNAHSVIFISSPALSPNCLTRVPLTLTLKPHKPSFTNPKVHPRIQIKNALWGYLRLSWKLPSILYVCQDSKRQATEINSCSFKQKRKLREANGKLAVPRMRRNQAQALHEEQCPKLGHWAGPGRHCCHPHRAQTLKLVLCTTYGTRYVASTGH